MFASEKIKRANRKGLLTDNQTIELLSCLRKILAGNRHNTKKLGHT